MIESSRSDTVRSYSLHLDGPLEDVFAWTSDVGRLSDLTPSWFRLEPKEALVPRPSVGAEIAYRFGWRGLALRWTSRIVDWRPPSFFAYEQIDGPFRRFRHEHFYWSELSGTRVVDRLIYCTWGGQWIDRLLVGPELDRIFAFRAGALRRLAEEGERGSSRGANKSPGQLAAVAPAKRMP